LQLAAHRRTRLWYEGKLVLVQVENQEGRGKRKKRGLANIATQGKTSLEHIHEKTHDPQSFAWAKEGGKKMEETIAAIKHRGPRGRVHRKGNPRRKCWARKETIEGEGREISGLKRMRT